MTTQVTCIGEVIATDELEKGITGPNIKLTYQGTAVTEQNPFPFNDFPDLEGYQHFRG